MSQYNPDDIPDELIVNGEGKEDRRGFPDKLYTREADLDEGRTLTGFAANLSDAEDGRDDDVPGWPKWKTANGNRALHLLLGECALPTPRRTARLTPRRCSSQFPKTCPAYC